MGAIFSPVSVALLVGAAVFALVMSLRPKRLPRAVEGRLEAFLTREVVYPELPAAEVGEVRDSFLERIVVPAIRRGINALGRIAPSTQAEEIRRKLMVAGRPGNLSPADFMGIQLLLTIVGLVLGYFYGRGLSANPRMLLLGPLAGAALGYMLPNFWLSSRVRQRQEAIQRALPDALDMLTICVEAGLAFESALKRVSEQWQGPLSDEFARLVSEMRLGVPRDQALRRFADRCGTPDVSSFVAVLVQADRMGTSIGQVLHSQAAQIRTLRRQRAEEKANKAPIKVLIAMLLFIFPALFVVILGPAVPKIVQTFSNMSLGGR
jgi:tight adherence protein C